jgi:hypothetical protein
LKDSGKVPDMRDEFINDVIEGRSLSKHSIKRGVGIGSRSQVFGADFMIVLLTVSSVTGKKFGKEDVVNGSVLGRREASETDASSSCLISAILFRKKSEKICGS